VNQILGIPGDNVAPGEAAQLAFSFLWHQQQPLPSSIDLDWFSGSQDPIEKSIEICPQLRRFHYHSPTITLAWSYVKWYDNAYVPVSHAAVSMKPDTMSSLA
jgi:hypothetical protein